MPVIIRCSVVGCGNTRESPGIKFFTFPIDTKLSELWVLFTKNHYLKQLLQKGSHGALKNYRVCSAHFRDSDFQNHLLEKLLRRRVPTLYATEAGAWSVEDTTTSSHHAMDIADLMVTSTPLPTVQEITDPSISVTVPADTGPKRRCLFSGGAPSDQLADALPSSSAKFVETSLTLQNVGLTRHSHCTPKKKLLFSYGKRREMEVKRLRKVCHNLKKKVRNLKQLLNRGLTVVEKLKEQLPPNAAALVASQVQQTKRMPQGRRWTTEEKTLALSLYKKNPAGYSLLQQMLVLPSTRTLTSYLNAIPFCTGVNLPIMRAIANACNGMQSYERKCVLIFVEMQIREHLQYDKAADKILGFSDLGELGRGMSTARYALVFMVRGIFSNWKQPVSFYFNHSQIKAENLVALIKVALRHSFEAGLEVMATVCDMGANNRKAIKSLGATAEEPFFVFNEKEIVTVFDPPHLLKCTRNLLMGHDILLPLRIGSEVTDGIASWGDVVQSYNVDNQRVGFRQLEWMTARHVDPKGGGKMKVSVAAKVFSKKVAAYLTYGVQYGYMRPSATGTAHFLAAVGDMFDSVKGSEDRETKGKELRVKVSKDTKHVEFWRSAVHTVESWKFLDGRGRVCSQPPSQQGWIYTLRAFQILWELLSNQNDFPGVFSPRRVNQDPLENLFGCIRGQCGSNHNPTQPKFL